MSKEVQGVDLDMNNNALMNQGVIELSSASRIAPPLFSQLQVNDYNPADLQMANVLLIGNSGTGPNTLLSGITAPTLGQNRFLILVCASTGRSGVTLQNNNQLSLAPNRFLGTANVNMNANDTVTLWYDGTVQRWRFISTP